MHLPTLVAFAVLLQVPTPFHQTRPPFEAAGAEVVQAVRKNFLDEARATEWVRKHATYWAGAASEEDFNRLTNAAIGELRTSHTRYFSPSEPAYYGLRAIFRGYLKITDARYPSIGVDLTPDHFVRHVFANGPAHRAGLRRGDRILSCDGRPFQPIRSLEGPPSPRRLLVERRKGQAPIAIDVAPVRADPQEEWTEHLAKGSTVVEQNGRKVAVARVFSGAGPKVEEELQALIQGKFQTADALVVDFRDGWGGCPPTFVDLFNASTPVLTSRSRRDGDMRMDPHWRKPLVVLINGGSKSGKEVVAYSLKKHRRAVLVGERTGGAVVGGSPYPLASGGILYLAVADVRVDGEKLEGVGVAPDVPVADELHYTNGGDPQMDKAIDTAAKFSEKAVRPNAVQSKI